MHICAFYRYYERENLAKCNEWDVGTLVGLCYRSRTSLASLYIWHYTCRRRPVTFKQKALYVHTSKEMAEKNSLIKTPFIHNSSHSYLPTYLRVNTDITSSFIKLLWLLFVYNLHIFCVFRISPSKRCCHFTANSKVNKVQHVHPLIIGCFFECSLNFHRIVCGLTAQTPHKQWWWTTDWLRTTEQQPPYHQTQRNHGIRQPLSLSDQTPDRNSVLAQKTFYLYIFESCNWKQKYIFKILSLLLNKKKLNKIYIG